MLEHALIEYVLVEHMHRCKQLNRIIRPPSPCLGFAEAAKPVTNIPAATDVPTTSDMSAATDVTNVPATNSPATIRPISRLVRVLQAPCKHYATLIYVSNSMKNKYLLCKRGR